MMRSKERVNEETDFDGLEPVPRWRGSGRLGSEQPVHADVAAAGRVSLRARAELLLGLRRRGRRVLLPRGGQRNERVFRQVGRRVLRRLPEWLVQSRRRKRGRFGRRGTGAVDQQE